MSNNKKSQTKSKSKPIQAHDLNWDVMHVKELVDTNKISEAKDYVKKFFYHYQGQVFYYDGTKYTLYDRCKAMELIPDDIVKTISIPNVDTQKFEKTEFKLKNFLKTAEFMKDQYEPTIDFSKPQIFSKKTTKQGVELELKYINMCNQLPDDM